MIGSLGDTVFECSDSQILTFQQLSFSHSANYAEHKIIGRKGMAEFTGLNASTCSIQISFDEALGIDPMEQAETLKTMWADHLAVNFVLDGKPVGSGYWVIENISETWELVDNFGKPRRVLCTINMKEYYNT